MTKTKKIRVIDQGKIEEGDRVRVEFEGTVKRVRGEDYGGLVINHNGYDSEVFLGYGGTTGVTVEKITEIPELKPGQVYRTGDFTYVVRNKYVENVYKMVITNVELGGEYSNTSDFFTLYPDAELILDA